MKNNVMTQQTKTTLVDSAQEVGKKIHVTKDYSQFTFIKGNRKIRKNHVAGLTRAIAKEDKSKENPIIVNYTDGKFGIVEGQHRFIVWKDKKMPVYYILDDSATIETVQLLNRMRLNWDADDFLKSYAERGNEHYRKLLYYTTEYKISITNARVFLVENPSYSTFTNGKMTILDEGKGVMLLDAYMEMKPYVEVRAFKDRDFIYAFKETMSKISVKTLITKARESGWKIERQADKKGYLRAIEDILNWRNRTNITRLY